jgi:hypothetical protein
MNYKSKYLKYKNKYLLLKNKIGGKKEFKYEDYDIKKMREKIDQLNNDIKEINHLNIEIKNLKDDISDILKQIELEEKALKGNKEYMKKGYHNSKEIEEYKKKNKEIEKYIDEHKEELKNSELKLEEKETKKKLYMNVSNLKENIKIIEDRIKNPEIDTYNIIDDILKSYDFYFIIQELNYNFIELEDKNYIKKLINEIIRNIKNTTMTNYKRILDDNLFNLDIIYNIDLIDNISKILQEKNEKILKFKLNNFNDAYPNFFGLYDENKIKVNKEKLSLFRLMFLKSLNRTTNNLNKIVNDHLSLMTNNIKPDFLSIFEPQISYQSKVDKKPNYTFNDYINLLNSVSNIISNTNGSVSYAYMLERGTYPVFKVYTKESSSFRKIISGYHTDLSSLKDYAKDKYKQIDSLIKDLFNPLKKRIFGILLLEYLKNKLSNNDITFYHLKKELLKIYNNLKNTSSKNIMNFTFSINKSSYDNFLEFFLISLLNPKKRRYLCVHIGIDDISPSDNSGISIFDSIENIEDNSISILLKKHSNLMIIDLINNEYYHFEPHGQTSFDIENIHNSMKNIFKLWIEDIKKIYKKDSRFIMYQTGFSDTYITEKINKLEKFEFNNKELPIDPLQTYKPNCMGWSCLIIIYLHFTNLSISDIIKKINEIPIDVREEKMNEFILFCNKKYDHDKVLFPSYPLNL